MEKFLLLRDNKQTGPYSAADLEQLGLKSYDLIWVDGKSAAWRYPGEIDALKSFAPPVEEQPYDRFFRKEIEPEQHKEPSISKETINPFALTDKKSISVEPKFGTDTPSRHIFVSKPAKKPDQVFENKNDSEKKNDIKEKSGTDFVPVNHPYEKTAHAGYLPPVNMPQGFPDRSLQRSYENAVDTHSNRNNEPLLPSNAFVSKTDEKPQSVNTKRNKGFNPVYLMAAALFLFALISVFLYLNYKEQNKQLSRLNEIVLNMQQEGGSKPVTPVYNAVAPVIHPEINQIDTIGLTNLSLTPVKKSQDDKIIVAKTALKKAAKKDSIIEKPVINEIPESKPVLVNNTMDQGRAVKRRGALDQLKITTNDFKVGFLGGVSGLQVTLSNNGESPMEKVEVAVEYLSKENKVVKTQVITFKNIAPGAALTQDVPRVARGISVRCKIGDAQVSQSMASSEGPSGKTP